MKYMACNIYRYICVENESGWMLEYAVQEVWIGFLNIPQKIL
jgi:hypothetical protein